MFTTRGRLRPPGKTRPQLQGIVIRLMWSWLKAERGFVFIWIFRKQKVSLTSLRFACGEGFRLQLPVGS